MLTVNTSKVGYQAINGMLPYIFCIQTQDYGKDTFEIRISGCTFMKSENTIRSTLQWTSYLCSKFGGVAQLGRALLKEYCKGTFLSEDADVFVITPNRRTFFFSELENLNFGD